MIRSMTGFGQARFRYKNVKGLVEIRSLNHRYFEFSARLAVPLIPLEQKMKELVQQVVRRGKINLTVSLNGNLGEETVVLDKPRVALYLRELKELAKQLGFTSSFTMSDVLRLPNIFTIEKQEINAQQVWPAVASALRQALGRLVRMREREGRTLARDLTRRIAQIQDRIRQIQQASRSLVPQCKERLEKRLAELLTSRKIDESRLEQELVLFAEHCDVTEEIVRIGSHVEAFREAIAHEKEVGKKLDFLLQEINREANTISAKSVSAAISQHVVAIKTDLEKIREQIQNIE